MQKLLLTLFLFTCYSGLMAQAVTISSAESTMLDSMMKADPFLQLLEEGKKTNYIDISVGIGNGTFSANNNAANATGVTNQLVYTPSAIYRFKNGIGIGVTAFLANNTSGLELYQTGVVAAYDYHGKKISAGIAYTRFFSDKNKYNSKSVYQNDAYAYINKTNGIIQPGLAIGYSNGKYKEAAYRSFLLPRPRNPRGDTLIAGIDSTDNKTNYFSVSASAGHDFSFYNVLAKNDAIDFTPSLMLNFGSDNFTQTHTNRIFSDVRLSRLTSRSKTQSISNKFQVQSLGLSLNFTYGIGKFYLQPNVYFDYYLPQTDATRLGTLFSFTAGVTF
jgi:hypothetical protein